jgi:branched-chain amino acid transport system substrate-binding protein
MMRVAIPIFSILLLAACSTAPPPEISREIPAVTPEQEISSIRILNSEGDFQGVRRAARLFLEKYPEGTDADEVRLLAASADIELGLFDESLSLLEPLASRRPPDHASIEALLLQASAEQAKGSYSSSSRTLLFVLSNAQNSSQQSAAYSALAEIAGMLSVAEMDELRSVYGTDPGMEIVLRERLVFAEAARDTAAVRLIEAELEEAGSRPETPRLEKSEEVTVPVVIGRDAGREPSYRIGLLCPLGGRYAPIGQAFLRGASLALREGRWRGIEDVEIIVGDTRANPLVAGSVTDRLIEEEGVLVLVGGVLSSPTIAAAQVAQFKGTVILSPVATEPGIDRIGPWVFQTMTSSEAEIIAVAHVAAGELGLSRIAYLSLNDPGSRRVEQLFRAEVERSGGVICASEFYPEGSTDFHENIERLRESDPEALFIASDTEDLILILPQLSFYEFGVQLLGTSAWNSRRLIRMAGRDMEGAVFPGKISERYDEELFLAAAALLDEPPGEVNRFAVGGYKGIKIVLEAVRAGGGGREGVRGEMIRYFDEIRHPYLDFVSGQGIPIYIVRNERVEELLVVKDTP